MKINRYGEGDYEKIEEKSKIFLKRIMGNEKFELLQKNGKIDIEIDNKFLGIMPNGKTLYELYENGRVINKSKNQSYCIIPKENDYPKYDILAIKYAWLTHNPIFAEKVANRISLDRIGGTGSGTGTFVRTSRTSVGYTNFVREMTQRGWRQTEDYNQRNGTPDYGDYVDYLSQAGWSRKLININEQSDFVDIGKSNIGDTSRILYVRCPAGQKMTIMGVQQIPRGGELSVAYSLGLHITDENGEEIPDDTKIRITKEKSSGCIVQLARINYVDIKMIDCKSLYRFKQGIELNEDAHIMMYLVNSSCNIPSKNIKFKMEADMWNRINL